MMRELGKFPDDPDYETALAQSRVTPSGALYVPPPGTPGRNEAKQAAWYPKTTPTFSDALALVRRQIWTHATFPTSLCNAESEKVPRALLDHLAGLLCYAA